MYEAQSATKGEFLGREAKYEALSTKTFLACEFSGFYHYFMPASGGQARISGNNSCFCRQFSLKSFKHEKDNS